ncbi:MAG: ABC transporter ATP-binding protein [Pseudomonadota bacterium]
MPSLRFKAVHKNYPVRRSGAVAALRDFSLTVPDGKLTVLLGSSGCGKTTALRLAAGLETCDAGGILLDGRDLAGVPPGNRPLALVFQNYALYPQMTAAENLAYPLRMRGVAPREIQRRVDWVSDLLQLDPAELRRQPHALSGGQRQRVALGKALIREPAVLLLDEPFSSLDHNLRLILRGELRRIQQRLGITILMVTHDQADAAAVGDLMAVMDAGRLHQVDTPVAVRGRPADRFVAGFIGTPPMNFLTVAWDGDHARLPNGRRIRLPGLAAPPGRLQLGLWSEQLRFGEGAKGLGEVKVVGSEPSGTGTMVLVSFEEHSLVVRLDGMVAPQPGERRGLCLPEECTVFAEDGTRIGVRTVACESLPLALD